VAGEKPTSIFQKRGVDKQKRTVEGKKRVAQNLSAEEEREKGPDYEPIGEKSPRVSVLGSGRASPYSLKKKDRKKAERKSLG